MTELARSLKEVPARRVQPVAYPVRLGDLPPEACPAKRIVSRVSLLFASLPAFPVNLKGSIAFRLVCSQSPGSGCTGSPGYDFETRRDVTSVQVGVRLPIFDKNQGNIRMACAQVAHSQAELRRVQLSLNHRLVRAYACYRTAAATVQSDRKDNLPDAKGAGPRRRLVSACRIARRAAERTNREHHASMPSKCHVLPEGSIASGSTPFPPCDEESRLWHRGQEGGFFP
jgi:hypothetical protein